MGIAEGRGCSLLPIRQRSGLDFAVMSSDLTWGIYVAYFLEKYSLIWSPEQIESYVSDNFDPGCHFFGHQMAPVGPLAGHLEEGKSEEK